MTTPSAGNKLRHLNIFALSQSGNMTESTEANGESMRIDPQRAQVLAENIGSVLQRVEKAAGGRKVRLRVCTTWAS